MRRVLVATDGSDRARRAVEWAAEMANRYEAELIVLRVLLQPLSPGTQAGAVEATSDARDEAALRALAEEMAGSRGRAKTVTGEKPAPTICEVAYEEDVDVLVLGNAGMTGRKTFLLGNVPNWVSHNAPCTVIIVDTSDPQPGGVRRFFQRGA